MKVPAGTARMPGGPWGDQRTETSSIIQFDGQPENPRIAELDGIIRGMTPQTKKVLFDGMAGAIPNAAPSQAPGMISPAMPPAAPVAGQPEAQPAPLTNLRQMALPPSYNEVGAPSLPGMVGVSQPQLREMPDAPAIDLGMIPGSGGYQLQAPKLPGGISPRIGRSGPSARESEYDRLVKSGSGASQIKNPWARIPLQIADAIGSSFFPGISMALPGTELHHRMLVNDAADAVDAEQGILDNESERELRGAQATEAQAQAGAVPSRIAESEARAESLLHPKDDSEGKTVTTAKGIFGWNPATKRYDTKVGDAPADKGAVTHMLDRNGNAFKLNQDGTATPIMTPDGKQVQGMAPGPESEKPLGNVDQMNQAMTARYQVLHPGGALPPHFTLPPNATRGDYERIDKAMESTERALGTKAQQDTTNEMRRQTMQMTADNRERQNTKLKPPPPSAVKTITANNAAIRTIDEALRQIEANPTATGWEGFLPDWVSNRMDDKGTEARAAISNIGSLQIKDRTGAAMTDAEAQRLQPFIPGLRDDKDTVVKKLSKLKEQVGAINNDVREIYGEGQGYSPMPDAGQQSASQNSGGGITVTAPDGSPHKFSTQAEADAFKKLAGIK